MCIYITHARIYMCARTHVRAHVYNIPSYKNDNWDTENISLHARQLKRTHKHIHTWRLHTLDWMWQLSFRSVYFSCRRQEVSFGASTFLFEIEGFLFNASTFLVKNIDFLCRVVGFIYGTEDYLRPKQAVNHGLHGGWLAEKVPWDRKVFMGAPMNLNSSGAGPDIQFWKLRIFKTSHIQSTWLEPNILRTSCFSVFPCSKISFPELNADHLQPAVNRQPNYRG